MYSPGPACGQKARVESPVMSMAVNVAQWLNNTVAKRRRFSEDGTGLVINPGLLNNGRGKKYVMNAD